MGKIPEVTIDLQQQTEKLIEMLGGSGHFDVIRGKCGEDFLATTDTVMRKDDGSAKAPSRGEVDLKAFLNSAAIIRGKIAQLERDGFKLAAHEAREALKRPGYRMLGETEPFEKTVPVTLVMFNPEVTLAILAKKFMTPPHWCTVEEIPAGLYVPSYRKEGNQVITHRSLLESLRDHSRIMLDTLEKKISKRYVATYRDMHTSIVLPDTSQEDFNQDGRAQSTKISGKTFACAVYAKKEAILRCFSRKDQQKIALWEFNLPMMYASRDAHHLYFGLHFESEHDRWVKMRKPFCAAPTNGYGAIAYPGEAYHCFDKATQWLKGTRILLTS